MLPPVHTYEHAGVRVEIVYDERTGSPREMDNLGTIVGWAGRELKLGERQIDLEDTSRQEVITNLKRDGAGVIHPLYYSSHGPQCRLDIGDGLDEEVLRGSSGVVYVTAERLLSELAVTRITATVRRKARRLLAAEIQEYSHYLNGSVYGYLIRDRERDELASDFGFYGMDSCEAEANAVAEGCAKEQNAERVEAHLMACRGIQTIAARHGSHA
ncbi:MAG TPA: hypothetical protein VGL57_13485 [Solirubrobacteraceae bacterium]